MLAESIGTPAMLEQTAEECTELAQACLKLARLMRGENAVHKSLTDILDNLHEEIADVEICIGELKRSRTVCEETLTKWNAIKVKRIETRLAENGGKTHER